MAMVALHRESRPSRMDPMSQKITMTRITTHWTRSIISTGSSAEIVERVNFHLQPNVTGKLADNPIALGAAAPCASSHSKKHIPKSPSTRIKAASSPASF